MKFAHTQEFDHEFIPAARRIRKTREKLIVVLHGRGDSLVPFRDLQEELGLKEANLLLLNAPRKYLDGYTWYAFPPHQAPGILKARTKLFRMMMELENQGWQSKDIFFFGFSQGSLITCDFGMNYPQPLAGLIGISGYVYFFPNWKKKLPQAAYQTPWLLTHGVNDTALDIKTSRRHAQKLIDCGLPLKWLEFQKDHEIEAEEEVPMIRQFVQTNSKIINTYQISSL
jgi:phospholipase/carboxylesterase